MRLDIFSAGESVLLLGEGNFSFARNLLDHKLGIFIVATCFERQIFVEGQSDNIMYLEDHEVPVYLDVYATKIHEHRDIAAHRYSKVVFNFPHFGHGTHTIEEHRELLRNMFKSAQKVVREDGQMIVSLCRGQGGTPVDLAYCPYEKSWQVAEMGAHGSFILTAVEPYIPENFPNYKCHDADFSIEGAQVHIFSKCVPMFPVRMDDDEVEHRLENTSICLGGNTISLPTFLIELYDRNPLHNKKTPFSYFRDELLKELKDPATIKRPVEVMTDEDIPIFVEGTTGIPCEVPYDDRELMLRMNPKQVFEDALTVWDEWDPEGLIVHFGVYFSSLNAKDFLNVPPASVQYLLLGNSALTVAYRYFYRLAKLFRLDVATLLRPRNTRGERIPHPRETIDKKQISDLFTWQVGTEWCYVSPDYIEPDRVVSNNFSVIYKGASVDACIIYPDRLLETFFGEFLWRQIWSDTMHLKLFKHDPPQLICRKPALDPPIFELQVTLKPGEGKSIADNDLFRSLWLSAGHIIEKVEILEQSSYATMLIVRYRSMDVPLFRSRVTEIHQKIVLTMLTKTLGVVAV